MFDISKATVHHTNTQNERRKPGSEFFLFFFLMLNSAVHNYFLLTNVKTPTIVGIFTCMSRKSSTIGLSEPGKNRISGHLLYL